MPVLASRRVLCGRTLPFEWSVDAAGSLRQSPSQQDVNADTDRKPAVFDNETTNRPCIPVVLQGLCSHVQEATLTILSASFLCPFRGIGTYNVL